MVEIESIGAGTGSAVRIDPSSNRPDIGPDSAGARIGTAWPEGRFETVTITDLNLVLGRLNPDYFLGGLVALDLERAHAEVKRQIADPLGLEVETAAAGIVDLFEEQLRFGALARVLGKGYSPVDHALFCYGGGGPLHVSGYTRGAQYADVLVPTWAAGFSAYGCACADFSYRFDETASFSLSIGDENARERLEAGWRRLADKATVAFTDTGIDAREVTVRYLARMQYAGQLNDIEVTADDVTASLEALVARFEELYGRIYAQGARSPELGYAVTGLAVVGSTPVEKPVLPNEPETDGSPVAKEERAVWWTEFDGFARTPVFEQDHVRAGHAIPGPAIVESPATTFAIAPGRIARLDRHRIFHLETA
jgi:N-methylhydantoinase A/oxoprolinase/acetone carboxylase beta subunit